MNGKDARMASVWEFQGERNNPHPATFPIVLPLRIIMSLMRDKEGLVLDTYMGSGTTAIASKLMGQKYLGIELSKDYIDMAVSRIRNWNSCDNRALAKKEEALHFVKKSFQDRKKDKQLKIQDLG